VSEVIANFSTSENNQILGDLLLTVINDCEATLNTTKTGWFTFHRNVVGVLESLGRDKDALTLTEKKINFHKRALQQSDEKKDKNGKSQEQQEKALAKNYFDLGNIQYRKGNYTEATTSFTRSLNIRIKLFGEEHSETADSYHLLGATQHCLSDYTAALESYKRALDIRIKLFGEEHPETADSYHSLGVTQHCLSDYTAALESDKRALDIRIKLFGEQHPETADSYHSLGVTQLSLSDYIATL